MATVITYGTFDLFHIGHLNLLRRLRGMGNRLVVGCSTDEFNEVKGKKTVIKFSDRRSILESIRYVDKVIPECDWSQKRLDISREKADIFAIGDDWAGHFDDLQDICKVAYLPRTKDISTTDLKLVLTALSNERMFELKSKLQSIIIELENLSR